MDLPFVMSRCDSGPLVIFGGDVFLLLSVGNGATVSGVFSGTANAELPLGFFLWIMIFSIITFVFTVSQTE